jgi:hypothetical protein
VNLIQDYTYIYAFFFRHHPTEKKNNNNKQQKKTTTSKESKEKNHGKMNIKRNTNIWTHILSKTKREREK